MDYGEIEKAKFKAYIESPDYKAKIKQRVQVNEACMKDPMSILAAREMCKKDPVFFVNNFGWTFDPRPEHEPHYLPMILYPYQEDLIKRVINNIRTGKDLYVDKSRDMGVSWIVVVYAVLYLWLFEEGFSATLGSRKEALVDNRTKDSLFGMIDFALENLPPYLLPNRFNFKKHRMHLKFINPENYNLIAGESMNANFSRGSRKKVVIFDEFAFWEYAREAWESAGDTTPCRIAVTTPNGYNYAALLRDSHQVDVCSLHWTLHPLKDKEWYEHQKSRRTDEEVAQELDISYQKSQAGRVYPEWDDVKMGTYEYDPMLPLFVSWDFGKSDDTAIIWWQVPVNDKIRIIDCYANRGKLIDFYVPFITGLMPSDAVKYCKKDLECIESHKNYQKAIHFGDPAGRFTNQVVNKSVIDVLKTYGINVNFKEEAKDFQTRKTDSKMLMRNLVCNDNERTKYLSMCMSNACYPSGKGGGNNDVKSVKPNHDWTSHYRSSFEYFAVNFSSRFKTRKVMDRFDKNRFNKRKVVGY